MITTNGGDAAYTNPEQLLDSVDREFIERINNKITMYGTIPYTVPTRIIIETVKEAALMFYRYSYGRAKQMRYLLLKKSEIINYMESQKDRYEQMLGYGCKLPPFVSAVLKIYKSNDTNIRQPQSMQPSDNSSMQGGSTFAVSSTGYMMNGMRGINNHFYTMERTVRMAEVGQQMSVSGVGIPHNYNRGTNMLFLHVDVPSYDSFILKCSCNVDVQYLYNDDLFIKYVFARCKKELKRLISGHTFQLPGEVQLNGDEICANADDEIQQVEEVLKNHNSIGDVILFR